MGTDLTTHCASCGQKLAVSEEYAGMSGLCPRCGRLTSFPPAPEPPPRVLHDALTEGLLWGTIGSFALFVLGLFLPWQGGPGIQRGDGRLLVCLGLLLLGLLIATLRTRFQPELTIQCAGGFATFCFLFLSPRLSPTAGIGTYLCLLATLGASSCSLGLAVQHPLPLSWAHDWHTFLRWHLGTLVVQGGVVLLAILTWIVRWVT